MQQIPLRDFASLRMQLRWLMWLGLWSIAEYSLRVWTQAPSSTDRHRVERL